MNRFVLVIAAITTFVGCGTPGFQNPSSSSSHSAASSSTAQSSSASYSSWGSSQSSTASSSSSPSVTGILFEDDFEGYTLGQFPGAPWKTRIAFDITSNDTSRVSVVDTAYSGGGAVKVTSPGAFNPAFIFLDFAESAGQADHLFVRIYINASAGLGGDGGHAHIIELSQDGQNGIRYGEANGSIGVNTVAGGDPLSPQVGQADEDLDANRWYCLEVLFDKRPQYDELTTWVDDRVVHKISNDQGQWHEIWTNNGPDPDWLANAFANQIQFGWYAFGNVRGNSILFDDIVIGTERVGCNYLPSGNTGNGVIR